MVHVPWQIDEPLSLSSDSRFYYIDEIAYPRVTEVLNIISKPFLNKWYGVKGYVEANKILHTRGRYGTKFHKYVELLFQGCSLPKDENISNEFLNDIESFSDWFQSNNIVVEATEQHLFSKTNKYAGTADVICRKDGLRMIGDIKTSKAIYDTHWLQLAAYVSAFKELTGVEPVGVFIFQIRDGKYQYKEKKYSDLLNDYSAFLHALFLYNWRYGGGDGRA